MKIGILGSGDVAKTLAAGFLKHGHEVTLGTRDTAKLAEFIKTNTKANIGSFAEAAKFGETIVLAVAIYLEKQLLMQPIPLPMRRRKMVSSNISQISMAPYWRNCKGNSLMRILSKPSIQLALLPWSIHSSKAASPRCSSLAMMLAPRKP